MKRVYTMEDFPTKAIYKRDTNRIYFTTDFKDNEEITFHSFHGRPGSYQEGLARYTNGSKIKLINIKDIESVD